MAEDSSDSISTTLDSDPPQSDPSPSLSRNLSASRLNAKAPEFVPRSNSMDRNQQQQQAPLLYHQPPGSGFFHARVPVQNHRVYPHQVPVQYHHHPTHHQPQQLVQAQVQGGAVVDSDHGGRNGGLTEEATQKILNQA